MIAQQFVRLGRYCEGQGLEFGEGDDHISSAAQVRTGRRNISGLPVFTHEPHRLPNAEGSLDYICCVHYIEHYRNTEQIFKHWWSLLRGGGRLVIALPEAGLYPHVGQPDCNPDHRVDFTLAGLLDDFGKYGFEFDVVEKGFTGDSFFIVLGKYGGAGVESDSHLPLPKYTVVMPFYNNGTMTRKCLDSLFANANPGEVILIDDGSTDTHKFYYTGARTIRNTRNSGFPYSVNRAVKEAKHEFVVLLNNDVTMQAGGIEKMLSALRDPSVAMAGQDGGKLDGDYKFTHKVQTDPDYIEMFCCAFRKSVWEKIGPLDLDFGRGYGEDSDWGIRARQVGYRLKTVGKCCEHKEGSTFGRGPDVMAQIERNRQYLMQKHHRGKCLWVMASLGCNGGSKVVQKMATAMLEDGWQVDVCSFTPWETAAKGWERFGHVTRETVDAEYDAVFSTFHSTMPFAAEVKCKHRFALVQSDEPAWFLDVDQREDAMCNFMLPEFKAIIIADHMRDFGEKYGMRIVGQVDNGVDSVTFHPTWTFEREWPHKIMLIRKGADVWYAGQVHAEKAVLELSKRYRDFGVVVLGGEKPNWPCKVEHHRTYDEREIRDLYNSVSAMVVPSLIEGCSLVPLEAMASGCPVVSTRVGMDYAVDNESYLLVPHSDSGAIVEAVSRVFDDADLRCRLYKNGLKIAHSRTWQREAEQFMGIISRETA